MSNAADAPIAPPVMSVPMPKGSSIALERSSPKMIKLMYSKNFVIVLRNALLKRKSCFLIFTLAVRPDQKSVKTSTTIKSTSHRRSNSTCINSA